MENFKKMSRALGFALVSGIILFSCSNNDDAKQQAQVEWAQPEAIKSGVPLSEAQLNATSSTAGTFNYTPSLGEVLEVGEGQTLSVEFIPDNQTDFSGAAASTTIDVIENGVSTANFSESITYDVVVDADGNAYKTVTIGNQEWMAENLRTTVFRNGDPIPTISSNGSWVALTSAAYAAYDNSTSLDDQATHGLLYNWFAVVDNRDIAPEGWHVATQADWEALAAALGGTNVAGGKLKESSNAHWNSPNTGATNESGFTALPSGRREYTDGSFINFGFNAFWWTSTAYNPDYSWYFQMNYDTQNIIAANFHKQYGFAVRCVKNAE